MQQPNNTNPMNFPFTLAPMGSQQFYNMAQNHAMVNSGYPAPTPAYVPFTEDNLYHNVPASYYHPNSVPTTANLPMNSVYVPSHETVTNGWNWPCESLPVHSTPAAGIESLDSADFFRAAAAAAHDVLSPRRGIDSISPRGANFPAYEPVQALPLAVSMPTTVPSSGSHEIENISDEPLPDEFKWRKYGQKQVKGSVYPRNYYKCTVSGCSAKKHLEKFFDTQMNKERLRTIYLGEHVHPTPASPHMFVTNQQDFRSNVLAQSNKIRQLSQESSWGRGTSEASDDERLVVECLTQVDENEDGYFWRKYGQKSVKGSFAPRQYYRCRNTDCRVKKQVEASTSGNTIVTYEGVHNHEPGVLPEGSAPAVVVSCPSPAPALSSAFPLTFSVPKFEELPAPVARVKREFVESPYPYADSPSSSISTTEDDGASVSSDLPSPKRSKLDEVESALHYFCEMPHARDDLHWESAPFESSEFVPRFAPDFFLESVAQE